MTLPVQARELVTTNATSTAPASAAGWDQARSQALASEPATAGMGEGTLVAQAPASAPAEATRLLPDGSTLVQKANGDVVIRTTGGAEVATSAAEAEAGVATVGELAASAAGVVGLAGVLAFGFDIITGSSANGNLADIGMSFPGARVLGNTLVGPGGEVLITQGRNIFGNPTFDYNQDNLARYRQTLQEIANARTTPAPGNAPTPAPTASTSAPATPESAAGTPDVPAYVPPKPSPEELRSADFLNASQVVSGLGNGTNTLGFMTYLPGQQAQAERGAADTNAQNQGLGIPERHVVLTYTGPNGTRIPIEVWNRSPAGTQDNVLSFARSPTQPREGRITPRTDLKPIPFHAAPGITATTPGESGTVQRQIAASQAAEARQDKARGQIAAILSRGDLPLDGLTVRGPLDPVQINAAAARLGAGDATTLRRAAGDLDQAYAEEDKVQGFNPGVSARGDQAAGNARAVAQAIEARTGTTATGTAPTGSAGNTPASEPTPNPDEDFTRRVLPGLTPNEQEAWRRYAEANPSIVTLVREAGHDATDGDRTEAARALVRGAYGQDVVAWLRNGGTAGAPPPGGGNRTTTATAPGEPEDAWTTAIRPGQTFRRADLPVVNADFTNPAGTNPLDGRVNVQLDSQGRVIPQRFILSTPIPNRPGRSSERLVTVTSGDQLSDADRRQLRATIISGNTATYNATQNEEIERSLSQSRLLVTVQNIQSSADAGTVTTRGFPATASLRTNQYPGTSYVQFVVAGSGGTDFNRVDPTPPGATALKPDGTPRLTYSVPGGATQATAALLAAARSLGLPSTAYYNTRPGQRTPDQRVTDIYRDLTPGSVTFEGQLPDLRIRNYIIEPRSDGTWPYGFTPGNPATGEHPTFNGQPVPPPPTTTEQPIHEERQLPGSGGEGDGTTGASQSPPGTGGTATPQAPGSGATQPTQPTTPNDLTGQPPQGQARIGQPPRTPGVPDIPFDQLNASDLPFNAGDAGQLADLTRRYAEGVGSAAYRSNIEQPVQRFVQNRVLQPLSQNIVQPALNSPTGQIVSRATGDLVDDFAGRIAPVTTPVARGLTRLHDATLGNPALWSGLQAFGAGARTTLRGGAVATFGALAVAAQQGRLLTGVATAGDPNLNPQAREVARGLNIPRGTTFQYYYATVPNVPAGRAFAAVGAAPYSVLPPATGLGQAGHAQPWLGPNNVTQRATGTSTAVATGPIVLGGWSIGTTNLNVAQTFNAQVGRLAANAPRVDVGTGRGGTANPVDLTALLGAADLASAGSNATVNIGPVAVLIQRNRDPVSGKVNIGTGGVTVDPTVQGRPSSIWPVLTLNSGYDPNAPDARALDDTWHQLLNDAGTLHQQAESQLQTGVQQRAVPNPDASRDTRAGS